MNEEEIKRKELYEIRAPSFRRIFKGHYSDQKIEEMINESIDNDLSIKKVPNAVHVQYVGKVFNEEFPIFEKKLDEAGLVLSKYDDSLSPKASLEEFVFAVWIGISQVVLSGLYEDIKGNLKWDAIKYIVRTIYFKLQGKTYSKIQGKKITEKEFTFGVKIQVDKYKRTEFSFEGIDKNDLEIAMDKILILIKDMLFANSNEINNKPKYIFDHKTKTWQRKD